MTTLIELGRITLVELGSSALYCCWAMSVLRKSLWLMNKEMNLCVLSVHFASSYGLLNSFKARFV